MAEAANERVKVGSRVLVVNDDRDSADMLAEVLVSEGHHVVVAYSGAEAVACAASLRPQCVFLDLDLRSEPSGAEVCRRLIASSTERPRIIAMTGALTVDRMRLQEIGFDAHVSIPIDVRRILQLLS